MVASREISAHQLAVQGRQELSSSLASLPASPVVPLSAVVVAGMVRCFYAPTGSRPLPVACPDLIAPPLPPPGSILADLVWAPG